MQNHDEAIIRKALQIIRQHLASGGRAGFDDGGAIERLRDLIAHGGIDSNANTFDSLPAPSPSLPGGVESEPGNVGGSNAMGYAGGSNTPGYSGGASTPGSVGNAGTPGNVGGSSSAPVSNNGIWGSISEDTDAPSAPGAAAPGAAAPGTPAAPTDPNSVPGINDVWGYTLPDVPAYPVTPVEESDLPAPAPVAPAPVAPVAAPVAPVAPVEPEEPEDPYEDPYEDVPDVAPAPVEDTPDETTNSAMSTNVGPWGALSYDTSDMKGDYLGEVSPSSTDKNSMRAEDLSKSIVGPSEDPANDVMPGNMEDSSISNSDSEAEGTSDDSGNDSGDDSGGGTDGSGDSGGGSGGDGDGGGGGGGGGDGGGGGGGDGEKRGGRIAKHHYIPQEDPIVKKALMLVSKKATSLPGRRIS